MNVSLRIAMAQINGIVGDLPGNQEKILAAVERACDRQADWVVFPELMLTGYPPEDLLLKEQFIQDSLNALKKTARRISGITAVIGCVDRDDGGNVYNAAAVVFNGHVQHMYHKQRLPNYGVFDEKRYFVEGKGPGVVTCGPARVGISICEDIWDPEGVPRVQAQKGADVFVNLSSSPFDYQKRRRRQAVLKDVVKRFHRPVVYVNLVGGQDELVFDGGSLALTAQGRVAVEARRFAEDLRCIDIPLLHKRERRLRSVAATPPPQENKESFPPQPRPSQLSLDEELWEALILGTRDYVRKNDFKKVVVGISGGIDSALVTVLACEALGADNVIGVSMPSVFSSSATREDARRVAENLKIIFYEIPITPMVEAYQKTLKPLFAGTAPGIAEENIQARIRGNLLMALSNKFGWLVLTTGNKSELAVGYCTLYGDMSGGFGVIKDVPKTKVYDLARLACRKRGPVIPEELFARPPTAELRPGQKDEDALPPYPILDEFLQAYVEQHASPRVLSRRFFDKALLAELVRKVDRSEYKRRQAAPGIKLSPRAFGRDWRLPITNKYKGL